MLWGDRKKEISKGYRWTTNNRMELLAVIEGLEALKKPKFPIEVFSDSKYVVDAVSKGWVFKWEQKGFKDKKNPDLWRRFLLIYRKFDVRFNWVKGHAGDALNEHVDKLAVGAYQKKNLLIDEGYERTNPRPGDGVSLFSE